MKNILFILLFALPISILSQENKEYEAERYLTKSIAKRKTANVLALTGGGLFLTGIIVASADHKENVFLPTGLVVVSAMIVLGVISGLTSVPFYISAGHNKRKYLKITPTAAISTKNNGSRDENFALVGVQISF